MCKGRTKVLRRARMMTTVAALGSVPIFRLGAMGVRVGLLRCSARLCALPCAQTCCCLRTGLNPARASRGKGRLWALCKTASRVERTFTVQER